MVDISDLIEFENENSNLDFKKIQYKKEMYESFLKDIMSLSNSMSKDDKYIIIGVKHNTNGKRDLVGISETFVDEATYQQIVDANIEPHINFSYFPYQYNEKIFGVFHIIDCIDPPYMMKKDFGNLKTGDSYIRKGSFQKRLTRKDIDAYINILKSNDISKDIKISLAEDEIVSELILEPFQINLPSEVNRIKIEEIILKKEKQLGELPTSLQKLLEISTFNPYVTSYENKDLKTLRNDLENIKETYEQHDEHYLNEDAAYKLNIFIHNNSSEFLEETSIEILIPKSDKYIIRDSIANEPSYYNPLVNFTSKAPTWEDLNYPSIEEKNDYYKVYEEIGNIKHNVPAGSLKVPLRLVIENDVKELEFIIDVKIFAKNIKNPISHKLKIKL